MEPESSQELAASPYPQPEESSPQLPTLFLYNPF
jgi:hypothetical protein